MFATRIKIQIFYTAYIFDLTSFHSSLVCYIATTIIFLKNAMPISISEPLIILMKHSPYPNFKFSLEAKWSYQSFPITFYYILEDVMSEGTLKIKWKVNSMMQNL